MWDAREHLWQVIEDGAHLYVCGYVFALQLNLFFSHFLKSNAKVGKLLIALNVLSRLPRGALLHESLKNMIFGAPVFESVANRKRSRCTF